MDPKDMVSEESFQWPDTELPVEELASTNNFSQFAVSSSTCDIAPGDGASSAAVTDAFAATFATMGGEAGIGCPNDSVYDWDGVPSQDFADGSTLVYNAGRGSVFYVGLNYWIGYAIADGPGGSLGLPIQHSTDAEYPPAYYQDYTSDFTSEPVQLYEYGFVGYNSFSGWRGAQHYPLACAVQATSIRIFVPGTPTDDDPNPPDIEKKKVSITIGGLANPGNMAAGDVFRSGVVEVRNSTTGQSEAGTMVPNGSAFVYQTELVDPEDELSFSADMYRQSDGRVGFAPQSWYLDGSEYQVPAGYGSFTLSGCSGVSLPPGSGGSGGVYTPPADTIPPVIGNPGLFQNGTGGVTVWVEVTDNVAVATVSLNIDGTNYPMLPLGNNMYAAAAFGLSVGTHEFFIVAKDTAPAPGPNVARKPAEGVFTFKIEKSGYYGYVPWQGYSPDPVNTNLGNYVYQYTDLKLEVPGSDLIVERFYNGQSSFVGLFGQGWTTTFDMHVTAVDNLLMAGAQVRYADGRTVNFMAEGNGFKRGEWVFDTLAREGDGYLLTRTDNTRFHFSAEGRLVRIDDLSGNAHTLTWNGDQLDQVSTSSGHSVTFTSSGSLVSRIDAPAAVSLEYMYEGDKLASVKDGTGATVSYRYDSNNGIVGLQTPQGHDFLAEQTFDDQGRVLFQRVGDNFINRFTYDDEQRTSTIEDTYGNIITYRYDDKDRLVEQIDPLGHSEKFEYNADNQRTKYIDRNGNATSYEYNANGDVIAVTDPLGQRTISTYDNAHHLLSQTDPLGRVTSYEYDAQGRQTATINALGERVEMRYNQQGQVVEQISARGFSMYSSYDSQGNLTEVRDALGNTTKYEYDGLGRRVKSVDPLGRTTVSTYDANGNLLTETDPLGHVTQYTYDLNNNRSTETDANGHTTTYQYNHLDTHVATIAPDAGTTTTVYDDLNHRIAETDALSNTTRWGLDAGYRVISETNALGYTTIYGYDPQGNVTSVTDPRGFITTYEYDALNRLVRIVDALGGATLYSYDAVGNRIGEIKPNGAVTTYAFDELNREIATIDALGFVTSATFDPDGNRINSVDAVGAVASFEYDALNRLVKQTDALGHSTLYTYDAVGNQTSTTDALGFSTRSFYDEANRLIKQTDALGNSTQYAYDAVGNQISATDALGHTTQFAYDAANRRTSQIDALGGREVTVYTLTGWQSSVTNAKGHVTRYTYDPLGRVVAVTDALGFVTSSAYDAGGNSIAKTNQNGHTSVAGYDALNRVVMQTNPLGFATHFEYDAVGNLLKKTDALGFSTIYDYDLLGQRIGETNALGYSTEYAYNPKGWIIRTTSADGGVVSKEYDALGKIVHETDALGFVRSFVYDAVGNKISSTDANGFVTSIEYDGLRRQIKLRDDIGVVRQNIYDAVGNLIGISDGNGHLTSFTFDALHRQTHVIDATGDTTISVFDAVGNIVKLIDGNGHPTVYDYDARSQRIAQTDPLSHTTRTEYDGVGQPVRVVDALGIATLNQYDPAGQLTAVILNYRPGMQPTPSINVTTRYEYDAVGNSIRTTDPNGNSVTFTSDGLGQLVAERDPLGHLTQYRFDAVGRQIERLDPNGTTVVSAYDLNGRLVRTIYPDGRMVARTYDGNGNMLVVTANSGLIDRSYDTRNRLVSETTAQGTVKYTYDGANNRLSMRYPDGRTLNWVYFDDNQLQTVVNPDGAVTSYERDGVDQVLLQTNGNNTRTANQFDAANNLLSTTTKQLGQGNKLIASVAYRYNEVKQRTEAAWRYRTGNPKDVTEFYTYDALRRLIGTRDSDGAQSSYAYDAADNRLRWQSNDDPRTLRPNDRLDLVYSYNAANELVRVADQLSKMVTTYRYDANGNRLEQLAGRNGRTFVYDEEHRLTLVQDFTVAGGKRVSHEVAAMLYDGDGRRIARSEDHKAGGGGIQTTTYAYDSLNPIATYETWHPHHANLYRTDSDHILAMDSYTSADSGKVHWFAQDALGSTMALSKFDGQGEHHYRYDVFGSLKPENSGNFGPHNPFMFTGQEYDGFIGLYHFHARAYDPATGTWLTRDPYRGTPDDPQSLHRYGYVKGNPTNLVDAYGYAAQSGTYGKALWLGLNFLIDFTQKYGTPIEEGCCGPDATDWFTNELNTNKDHPTIKTLRDYNWIKYVPGVNLGFIGAALVDFRSLVKGGGPWDYKAESRPLGKFNFEKGHPPDSSTCPSGNCPRSITMCGMCVNYDVPGNINYGYTGAAAGYRDWLLHFGGDYAQEGGTDPPEDVAAIDIGIEMWDKGTSLCTLLQSRSAELNMGPENCKACNTSFN
ncbi:MAG TPA: DUF6531 domain-containing protein [Herpetosiphonaceae bacterium]|nr:DUF6531 domain-containing protein [Herpetosiphonaceae bacterium]